jgi:hypothetical protein
VHKTFRVHRTYDVQFEDDDFVLFCSWLEADKANKDWYDTVMENPELEDNRISDVDGLIREEIALWLTYEHDTGNDAGTTEIVDGEVYEV